MCSLIKVRRIRFYDKIYKKFFIIIRENRMKAIYPINIKHKMKKVDNDQ